MLSPLKQPLASTPAQARPKSINIDREIERPENDILGWHKQAHRLGEYLAFHVDTPVLIGIQGDWGRGKTSFINLMVNSLGVELPLPVQPAPAPAKKGAAKPRPAAKTMAGELHHYQCTFQDARQSKQAHIYVLRFDSWVFAQSHYTADELLPVYVSQVVEDYLGCAGKLKRKETTLAERFASLGRAGLITAAGAIGGEAASKAVDIALPTAQPGPLVNQLSSFMREFQELVDNLLEPTADRETGNKAYPNRLLIIVDDLDRISPVTAVDITEKIKVFLNVGGVIFILAADLGIIQQGLEQKFGRAAHAEGKNYLDKIIKIQYNVPPLDEFDLASVALGYPTFVQAFGLRRETSPAELVGQDYFTLLRLFPTVGSNIRNSKRVLLNFEFSYYLLSATAQPGAAAAFRLLAVTILHQYDHDLARAFYRWLANPAHDDNRLVGAEAGDEEDLLAALDVAGTRQAETVRQFFQILLGRKYSVAAWRAAYTAAKMGTVEEMPPPNKS